jgi:ATP-dependent Clp protease ATP-binding subunit ClpB
LKAAIDELRKGERVTSASAEETYNSLNKYAKNLNEMAKGKLDPVIGRDEEIRRVLQILTRRTKNNLCLWENPEWEKQPLPKVCHIELWTVMFRIT